MNAVLTHVGQVSLYRIDWDRHRAEYGRLLIGEADAARRGLARAATTVLLQHAAVAWGLREVELEVFADNVPRLRSTRPAGSPFANSAAPCST